MCPAGWHVPSVAEWVQLQEYLENNDDYTCDGGVAKAMASTEYWQFESVPECSPSDNTTPNNTSGFSAELVGYYDGWFEAFNSSYNVGGLAVFSSCFWTSSKNDGDEVIYYYLQNGPDLEFLSVDNTDEPHAMSVRCVRD